MRWRQVIGLYVVMAALAAEYWLVERRPALPEASTPAPRQRLLAVGPDELDEVRLLRGGRAVVLRRDDGTWRVVEPAGVTIPPDLIAAFAAALTSAEEIDRVADSQEAKGFGLDDEAARIEVRAGRGAPPLIVTLGGTNPTGTAVYARRAGAEGVVLIGRNVRYYEELIFQALPTGEVPAADHDAPVGG